MSTFVTERISSSKGIDHSVETGPVRERNRRVVVSGGVGIFQRLVQVGSTLVVMPLLLRVLGPTRFGIWGATASLAWLSGLVDIGMGTALVTLVARSSAPEHTERARRHIAGALSAGSGVAGLLLLMAFVVLISSGSEGTALGPYLIAIVGLAINIPLNAGNNVWMALQKGYVSASWELVQTLLTTAGLIAAAQFTTDVRIYVAIVYLGLIVANAGSLAHLFLRHREFRPQGLWASRRAMREVAGQGMLYFAVAVTGGLSFMLDNVLALRLLGPEASARMTIALRICITAVGALVVLSQPLWPAFADAAERADRKWIVGALLRGSAFLSILTVTGAAILLIYGETMLHWWLHTDLGIGQSLLWAIAAWVLAQALFRVPNLLLNGLSILRYQIVIFSIGTSVAFALKFALAPYFGVAGILWGTSATVFLIVIPASIWRIRQWATE
ncbi:MAG: lipopolysaccharide biosynthesis protein [Terriglobales bacterium]